MVTDDELKLRLADHEDNFVERKPSGVNERELRQTLSAFANALAPDRAGVLFIGIADKGGAVVGVANTDSEQKHVRKAADACYRACQ
ncbi:AlbA family DNA-binding domain-containing protein [Burkholderia guangdongensis]|uniref:AlbA family DNA-binding domain-containing protein n=1 Tax=Burkholderia guangdongensis TaxID=1792500 RepID=UPI0015CC51BC|nr:ATP-binding protein [Burkholderia guangdongensis]